MFAEIVLMFAGQIAAAISIFFIVESQLAPGMLAAYRLFLASILMFPLFYRESTELSRRLGITGAGMLVHLIRHSLAPGLLLGLHFIFWNTGARLTIAANATLFVNMTPVVMPLAVFFLTGEKPGAKEALATALAISGAVLLSLGDLSLGSDHLRGNLFAFISMLFLTFYLALSRRNKDLPFWYYIWGVYLIGGVTSFTADLALGAELWSDRGIVDVFPVIGLTLVSTIIGHNLINRAMRQIPSQIVGVGQLSQFLWAGILAWLLYGELPTPIFYPSMGLIAAGTIFMIMIHHENAASIGE